MALTAAERAELEELEAEHQKSGGSFESPSVSGMPMLNPQRESTLLKDVMQSSALPVMGGILGGSLGAIGGPAGAVGGATLGGAAGESYRQLGARAMGLPVPETATEAAQDIGTEGLTQGAGELIGGPVLRGAGKLVGKVPGVQTAASGIKKAAGDLFQIVTKMKPKDAETLFQNPKAILPSEWADAQKAWREAAAKEGIPIDDLDPRMIDVLKKDAKDVVYKTFDRLEAGENVTAAEAQLAKEALNIGMMPAAKNERNGKLIKILEGIKEKFIERIGKESPELAAANKKYAIAASGKKFRSAFPRNTNDSPAYFRSTIFPSLIGAGAGASYGNDPIERTVYGVGGGLLSAGLASPFAIGATIAGAGAARSYLPLLRRPISASLAELLDDELEGK